MACMQQSAAQHPRQRRQPSHCAPKLTWLHQDSRRDDHPWALGAAARRVSLHQSTGRAADTADNKESAGGDACTESWTPESYNLTTKLHQNLPHNVVSRARIRFRRCNERFDLDLDGLRYLFQQEKGLIQRSHSRTLVKGLNTNHGSITGRSHDCFHCIINRGIINFAHQEPDRD